MTRRGPFNLSTAARNPRRSRVVIAGKPDVCERCAGPIRPGDEVVFRDRNGARIIAHALCDEVES